MNLDVPNSITLNLEIRTVSKTKESEETAVAEAFHTLLFTNHLDKDVRILTSREMCIYHGICV